LRHRKKRYQNNFTIFFFNLPCPPPNQNFWLRQWP